MYLQDNHHKLAFKRKPDDCHSREFKFSQTTSYDSVYLDKSQMIAECIINIEFSSNVKRKFKCHLPVIEKNEPSFTCSTDLTQSANLGD